ncbi:MFS transporter [Halosegnis marinus]|uniref:MFS transporter n=1 Tax=Halosegnis marinus TaxID=3034023 RepID=A0ABD5ZPL6_9EURY|nr:MFS transporter [Halosegnis sp. DT85]
MRRLFANGDFTRLFAGRLVTNAGDSIYGVAAMWLVFSLTGSTFYTGLAGMLTLGMQLLQAFVGPLVDRWPLRRTLVATQAAQGVLVLAIPLADHLGVLSVWVVLTVMPLVSLLNQFTYPASSAALPRIVADPEDLTGANSLFAMTYQGAELVFNAAAGVLVALVGATALFLVDSVTFAAAVVLFAGIRVPPAEREAGDEAGYLAELVAGARFLRGSPVVWVLGAAVVANGLLGAAWPVLPAFAAERGDATLYGLLLSGLAGGTLVGSLLATRFRDVPFGRLSVIGFGLSGVAWLAALLVPGTAATVALFALAFVPVGVTNVVSMTLVQRLVPEAMLGRVLAVLGSGTTAAMPLGAFVGGVAGEAFGPVAVMYAGGVGFLWIVGYVLAVPALRRMPAATAVEAPDAPADDPGTGPAPAAATNAD